MEHVVQMADLSGLLRHSLSDLNESKQPDENFTRALHMLRRLNEVDAQEVLGTIIHQACEKHNIAYLKQILKELEQELRQWMFFMMEPCNTALDMLLALGEVKTAFFILRLLRPCADARTLGILNKYATLYRDKKVQARMITLRKEIEKKVAACLKRLEYTEIEPIVTLYDTWQE